MKQNSNLFISEAYWFMQ